MEFNLNLKVIKNEDRTYVELPDGLRLIFSENGYEGHYDPDLEEAV